MTIASVTTDIEIGPYKIPSNAQNMIMNFYAARNSIPIEIVIPEPLLSNKLATTIWLHNEFNFSKVLLSSIHQLPRSNNDLDAIVTAMSNVEFHFAIEGLKGTGKDFLNSVSQEVKIFNKCEQIDAYKLGWIGLQRLFKDSHENAYAKKFKQKQ
jgi:hypothetical protein